MNSSATRAAVAAQVRGEWRRWRYAATRLGAAREGLCLIHSARALPARAALDLGESIGNGFELLEYAAEDARVVAVLSDGSTFALSG